MSSDTYVCGDCQDGWHSKCSAPDICECGQCQSEPLVQRPQQRIEELEKQVEQLVGDVQAVVADYTEEKQRREQAETRIKQLEGALQKYGRHQLYCEIRYDPSKCVCGFTDKEKGSDELL